MLNPLNHQIASHEPYPVLVVVMRVRWAAASTPRQKRQFDGSIITIQRRADKARATMKINFNLKYNIMKNKDLQLIDHINYGIYSFSELLPLFKTIKRNLLKGKTKFKIKISDNDIRPKIVNTLSELGLNLKKVGEYHYIFGNRNDDFEYEISITDEN